MKLPKPLVYVVEAIILALILLVAFKVRAAPWYNAWSVAEKLKSMGFSDWEYAFLHANDPWIEYWMAEKLHKHGLSYWFKLTPRYDPDARLFWWPHGRNFPKTAYPLVPMLIAATYPGGMPFSAWAALIPVIAGVVMVFLGYVIGRRVAGPIAGLSVAGVLALVPAAIDRTVAGFIEKEGISMPILFLWLLLLLEALRSRDRRLSLALAAISGGIGGVLAWSWGGWQLVPVALAALGLLLPAFTEYEEVLRRELVLVVNALSAFIVAAPSPHMNVKYALFYAASIVAPFAGWIVARVAYRVLEASSRWRVVSLAVGVTVFTIGIIIAAISPAIPLSSRAVYGLLWPLRFTRHFPPLVQSVAEHKMPSPQELGSSLGVLVVLGPIACLVGLYYAWTRRRPDLLMLSLLGLGGFDAVIGMAYFMQLGGSLLALASSMIYLPIVFYRAGPGKGRRRRRRREEEEVSTVKVLGFTLLGVVFIATCAAYAYADTNTYLHMLPSIDTAGIGSRFNPSWLKLLELLKTDTSSDTVVVTWWDYGYWVTVGAHRATLADGATLNGTQISLLARMLVSDEDTSSRIMRDFGLKPGKTIVVVYDVVLVSRRGNETIASYPIPGFVDIRKSYWMIRIGGYRVSDYFGFKVVRQGAALLRVLVPDPSKNATRKAVIYNLLVDAAYNMATKGVADVHPPVPGKITKVYFMGAYWPKPKLHHFKPWHVVAYELGLISPGVRAYVIIAAYRWVG